MGGHSKREFTSFCDVGALHLEDGRDFILSGKRALEIPSEVLNYSCFTQSTL